MAKFTKRPVMIDAVRFTGFDEGNMPQFDFFDEQPPRWLVSALNKRALYVGGEKRPKLRPVLLVHTLEGTMVASQYDYIIRGIKGEIYPCKPDIFERTHERLAA